MKHWLADIRQHHYQKIYLSGLFLFVIGLPLSKSLMTLALIILAVHWVLSGGYRRLPSIKTSVGIAFYAFSTIYLLHLFGLFHTIDLQYAAKDLRIKMPLLLLPLFMVCATPVSSRHISLLLKTFVVAVLAGSLVSLYILLVVNPVDPRDLTPFISHIRFSMMVCVALSVLFYFGIQEEKFTMKSGLTIFIVLWFLTFLILLEALTGIIALAIVLLSSLIYLFIHQKNGWVRAFFGFSLLLLLVFLILFAVQAKREFLFNTATISIDPQKKTSAGNDYMHDINSPVNENGHLVWLYVCEDELREEWNRRSVFSYDSVDENGSRKGDVLLRYLSSKGWRKDAEGVASLSDKDIAKIERGVTNCRYGKWNGLKRRFDELKWEYWQYQSGGGAAGHSILQRLELWKVGWSLAMENIWKGVGTGDVKREFASQLEEKDSSLQGSPMRAHNQYLSILIAFGLPGLILFVLGLLLPVLVDLKKINYLFLVFLLMMLLSMFTEDTLETQAGVSFFSFFFSLWIFQERDKPDFTYTSVMPTQKN